MADTPIAPDPGALTLSGTAPSLLKGTPLLPTEGGLSLTGFAPQLTGARVVASEHPEFVGTIRYTIRRRRIRR